MKRALLALVVWSMAGWASEDAIRKAEAGWAAMVEKRDVAGLERLYDEKLIYAHSSGVVETKAEYMERLKKGLQRYDGVKVESTRVAMHGEVAVALSMVRMTGQSNERKFDDHLMMTHVWLKRGGGWKLASHQTTKLAE